MSIIRNNQKHSFHLVDPSPWPFFSAFCVFFLALGTVMYMHGYVGGYFLWHLAYHTLSLTLYFWWRDVIREATFEGQHTKSVQTGLKMGMLLFILSEVMFFFAFFWAFFHSSLNPSLAIGCVWPPAYLTILDPWKVPLLNTVLLLSSGASVTWAHHSIVWGSKSQAFSALIITVVLAIIFTALQGFEYVTAPFTISDGIYGSTFYMATGFHGLHVIIGTHFLGICLARLIDNHFTREQHFGFEAALWPNRL
jgi:cytochrome c oxidase subunit 3